MCVPVRDGRARRPGPPDRMPPQNSILPRSAAIAPETSASAVDFPAPFGPMMDLISPALTSKLKPLTACTPPKAFSRSLTERRRSPLEDCARVAAVTSRGKTAEEGAPATKPARPLGANSVTSRGSNIRRSPAAHVAASRSSSGIQPSHTDAENAAPDTSAMPDNQHDDDRQRISSDRTIGRDELNIVNVQASAQCGNRGACNEHCDLK